MAIVIDGSGTITGISAGGLPDGTVTADDLASTLDLSGKTVTLAAGGTGYGKVLQVIRAQTTTAVTVASQTLSTIGLSASITPSSASSKILIITSVQANSTRSVATNWAIIGAQRTISGSTTSLGNLAACGNVNGTYFESTTTASYLDTPATTSAITYEILGSSYVTANSGQIIFQRASYPSSLVLIEIAA